MDPWPQLAEDRGRISWAIAFCNTLGVKARRFGYGGAAFGHGPSCPSADRRGSFRLEHALLKPRPVEVRSGFHLPADSSGDGLHRFTLEPAPASALGPLPRARAHPMMVSFVEPASAPRFRWLQGSYPWVTASPHRMCCCCFRRFSRCWRSGVSSLQGWGGLLLAREAHRASGAADNVLAGRDGGRRLVVVRMTPVAGLLGAVMGCTHGRCSWFVWSDVASPRASWLRRFAALPRIPPGGPLPGVLLVRRRT